MGSDIIPYDPYHPHLVYTLIASLLAWAIVTIYGRIALHNRPNQRITLAALVIGLPIYAEVTAYLIELIRPAPESQFGYLLTHFHARVISGYPIDTFLSPATIDLLLVGLSGLMLISLVRFLFGTISLNRVFKGTVPIAQTPYASVLERLAAAGQAERAALPPVLVGSLRLPIAFTTGVRHPRIYISAALLNLLNEDEILVVLCHEWAHVLRRDTLWTFLIRLQRDMLWFLPGSYLAWRSVLSSQDEACDQFAATLTRRPLTLARALVKVAAVQAKDPQPSLLAAQPFAILGKPPKQRVLRMIHLHENALTCPPTTSWGTTLLVTALLVIAILPALVGS